MNRPKSYSSHSWRNIRVEDPSPTGVVLIALARPEFHNALTIEMLDDLIEILGLIDTDDRVKCIVLTGDGKTFCAGVDLGRGFGPKGDPADNVIVRGGRLALAIHHCRKPSIAAMNGTAVGVGITMTLPMTVRVCTSTAKIGFVFARRGIIADAASSFYLPRLVGYSRAIHLFTTGAMYPANSPLLNDLFSEIVSAPDSTVSRALEIADDIACNTSQVSTGITKELIFRGPGTPEETHLLESRILYGLYDSNDFKEGVQAFLKKRPAKFTDTMDNYTLPVASWWPNAFKGSKL